jgi:hypothetical protein
LRHFLCVGFALCMAGAILVMPVLIPSWPLWATFLAWSVGGIFSVPIPNNTGQGDLEAAKLEAARQIVELKRLEQSILVEADNAAGQVETASKRIDAATQYARTARYSALQCRR